MASDFFFHRREELEIDAARDDGDALRVSSVQRGQQVLLVRARHDDAISGRRDAALRLDARRRLVFGGAGAILHFAEGVEHRDVRDAPACGEVDRDHSGHPVVAVDHVVRRALARNERQHVSLEFIEAAGDRALLDALCRTGVDADDAGVRAEGLDLGRLRGRPARKDIDDVTARAHRLAKLAHVHVHAARFASA